jgi:two-component system chemotaxis response regulator CheB
LSFSLDAQKKLIIAESIDVVLNFLCCLKRDCCGILLSGANHDGARGLK